MLPQETLRQLEQYIAQHREPAALAEIAAEELAAEPAAKLAHAPACLRRGDAELQKESAADPLLGFIEHHRSQETFSSRLLELIDQSGRTDAEVYRAAGIDRRHFSKIRSDVAYRPKKATATALGLALRLERAGLDELLALCGYSLSRSDTADLVVMFCLERGIYDLLRVNEALDYLGQPPLTGELGA